MRLRTLIMALTAVLLVTPHFSFAGGSESVPQIQVEVVPSDVHDNKVDIFVVITNPNDFDLYVGGISGGNFATEAQTIFGDGPPSKELKDFSLVPAHGKRVRRSFLGLRLKDGLNHVKVKLFGGIDPKAKPPSHYIPFGTYEFEFTILNEGSK